MDTQPVFPKGHLIDFENWERKDNYNFFRDFENPSISITSEVECARAKDRAKRMDNPSFSIICMPYCGRLMK